MNILSLGLILAMTKNILCKSEFIIDLSHWNNADLHTAKLDGIVAVIHKATQGTGFVDSQYAKRQEIAEKEGLLWGAYHFGTGKSGADQAKHFLKTVGSTSNVLIALDIEKNPSGDTMPVKEAEEFVLEVKKETGRYPIIYGSPYYLDEFSTPLLSVCPLWIAHWTSSPSPRLPKGWSSWTFWQYTNGESGGSPRKVNGIGGCDRDRYNGTLEELVHDWPNLQAPVLDSKNQPIDPAMEVMINQEGNNNMNRSTENEKNNTHQKTTPSSGQSVHRRILDDMKISYFLLVLVLKFKFY